MNPAHEFLYLRHHEACGTVVAQRFSREREFFGWNSRILSEEPLLAVATRRVDGRSFCTDCSVGTTSDDQAVFKQFLGSTRRVLNNLQAPVIRVPLEVVLPSTDGLQSNSTVLPRDTSTLDSLNQSETMRLQIKEDRGALRETNEPILHPSGSSYDLSIGLITTGQYADDREATWQLHGPEGSGVYHGLIIGDSQMGKSNGLWIVMLEAALSGVFLVIPADPRNEHNFLDRLRSAAPRRWGARPGRGLHHIRSLLRLTSTNKPIVGDRPWLNSKSFSETIDNLRTVCQVVDALATKGEYALPTRRKPGILLAIDDADEILRDASGSEMVEKILVEGGRIGVGVVVVVRDLTSPGGSSLIRSLVSVENGPCIYA